MPTISAGDKILVTGANGYLANWVVRSFLEKGYAVRGTVRSREKGKYLDEAFKSFGDKFEIVVVEDITKEGAFDEAVKGIDGIAHTASPFYLTAASVDEMIQPAVNGTVSVLKSAAKNGDRVKRIVVTSSCAAIATSGLDKVYTELDWNDASVNAIKEKGDAAGGGDKYRGSKVLAERAAWDFYEKNKATLKWDLSVLNPPFIFGPAIHDVKSFDALNTSAKLWHDTVLVGGRSKEALADGSSWVDVRDIAEAHVLTLEKEKAGGERLIISAGSYVWQDWSDAANALTSSPIPSHPKLPVGYPGLGRTVKAPVVYDTAKAERVLGLKYRTQEELTRDTLADFERRGW